VRRALFFAVALMAINPGARAAELWDFIRVGKNYQSAPKWEARSGKAQVDLKGDQIEIRVYTRKIRPPPHPISYENLGSRLRVRLELTTASRRNAYSRAQTEIQPN
jgi:hypothetical protein